MFPVIKTAIPTIRGLIRCGLFSTAQLNMSARNITSLKNGKLSDNPIVRMQQIAKRDPARLSMLLTAAHSVVSEPIFLTADCETTGIYPDKHGPHRILELGLTASRNGIIESSNHYLINPERAIHPEAIKIHGINDATVKKRPVFAKLSGHFLGLLQSYPDAKIWFHNAAFDKRMINAELQYSDPKQAAIFNEGRICCSLRLARILKPKGNKLDDLLARYDVDASSRNGGHGALIDSLLLAKVLPKLSEDVLTTAEYAGVLQDMLDIRKNVTFAPS